MARPIVAGIHGRACRSFRAVPHHQKCPLPSLPNRARPRGVYMMALATAAQIPSAGRTRLLSDRGQQSAIWLKPLRRPNREQPQPSIEARLDSARADAAVAVQNQVRYFEVGQARQLNAAIGAILNVDTWDEDDAIPTRQAVESLVRVIIALGLGLPQVTAADAGLVGSWQVGGSTLRVEANADETVRWNLLHPEGRTPRHQGDQTDRIETIVDAVTALLGSQGEHPRRR